MGAIATWLRVVDVVLCLGVLAFSAGYARLLVKRPRERRAVFASAWLVIAVALEIPLYVWGLPAVHHSLAETYADSIIEARESWRLLSARHPEFRAALREMIGEIAQSHRSLDGILADLLPRMAPVQGTFIGGYLTVASDHAVVEYFDAMREVLDQLAAVEPSACDALLVGDYKALAPAFVRLPNPVITRFSRAQEAAVVSGLNSPAPALSAGRRDEVLSVFASRLRLKYGEAQGNAVAALMNGTSQSTTQDSVCSALRVAMREVMEMESADRADLIRTFLISGDFT